MWVLVGLKTSEKKWLRPGKIYTIGRTDCDITIGDKSISRKHCIISVITCDDEQVLDLNSRSKVILQDTSKFGVYVDNVRVEEDQELHEGNILRLGLNFCLKLTWHPVVIRYSGNHFPEIIKEVKDLDIKVLSRGRPSSITTHLFMSKIQITQTLILALTEGIPLVSHAWIERIKSSNSLEENFDLPNESDFLPPFSDKVDKGLYDVNFNVVPARKTLFSGHKFVCFQSGQIDRAKDVIIAGGGEMTEVVLGRDVPNNIQAIMTLLEEKEKSKFNMLAPPGWGIGQADGEWIILEQAAKALKINFVPEYAIGLAVLYVSTDSFRASNIDDKNIKQELKQEEVSGTNDDRVRPSFMRLNTGNSAFEWDKPNTDIVIELDSYSGPKILPTKTSSSNFVHQSVLDVLGRKVNKITKEDLFKDIFGDSEEVLPQVMLKANDEGRTRLKSETFLQKHDIITHVPPVTSQTIEKVIPNPRTTQVVMQKKRILLHENSFSREEEGDVTYEQTMRRRFSKSPSPLPPPSPTYPSLFSPATAARASSALSAPESRKSISLKTTGLRSTSPKHISFSELKALQKKKKGYQQNNNQEDDKQKEKQEDNIIKGKKNVNERIRKGKKRMKTGQANKGEDEVAIESAIAKLLALDKSKEADTTDIDELNKQRNLVIVEAAEFLTKKSPSRPSKAQKQISQRNFKTFKKTQHRANPSRKDFIPLVEYAKQFDSGDDYWLKDSKRSVDSNSNSDYQD